MRVLGHTIIKSVKHFAFAACKIGIINDQVNFSGGTPPDIDTNCSRCKNGTS